MMDLTKLTIKELKKLQLEVDHAISTFEERAKKDALVAVEAKAKELGFNLGDLLGNTKPKAKRAKVAPKYAHPENPELTWTGRGRKPKWIEATLAEGKNLDDLLI